MSGSGAEVTAMKKFGPNKLTRSCNDVDFLKEN
jgi:hypothetical protein